MIALLSLLGGRAKLYAYAALAIAVAGFCLYMWSAKALAEHRAVDAEKARGEAIAQAQVLATALDSQNAAVQKLQKKLSFKVAAVKAAEAQAAKTLADANTRITQIMADTSTPTQCQPALDDLYNYYTRDAQ